MTAWMHGKYFNNSFKHSCNHAFNAVMHFLLHYGRFFHSKILMEGNEQNIMIIAGEVSGDLLGGELSRELLQLDNKIKLFGIGGDKMKHSRS